MDIRGKIAHGGRHPRVERAAVREVTAETHAGGADAAVAGLEGEEGGDGQLGVFIVRGHEFLDLPFVARVRTGDVIG